MRNQAHLHRLDAEDVFSGRHPGSGCSRPPLMNFQSRLVKPDGTPVANGIYSVRFSLWNTASAGYLCLSKQ